MQSISYFIMGTFLDLTMPYDKMNINDNEFLQYDESCRNLFDQLLSKVMQIRRKNHLIPFRVQPFHIM